MITSKHFLPRVALALAPLLAAATGTADTGLRARGLVAEACAPSADWQLGRPSGAQPPAVAEARAAPELPAREGGTPEPPVRRAPRCAAARLQYECSDAAKVHAATVARLNAVPCIAASLLGVFFGSTAPPPLPS